MKSNLKQVLTSIYLGVIFLVLITEVKGKILILLGLSIFYFLYNLIKAIIYLDKSNQTSLNHFLLAALSISFFFKIHYFYYNLFFHVIVIFLSIYLIKSFNDSKKTKRWKKQYLLILNIVLLFTSNNWMLSQIQSPNKKHWNKNLKWSEFQGKPKENSKVDASIVTGFNYKVNKSYNYPSALIMSFMNKNDSWKKEIVNSKELLIHEQGHFDITETYARFARDSIKSSWGKNPKEIEKIIDFFLEQKEKAQDQYDNETKHGVMLENQKEWNKKIIKWLE